MYRQVLDPVADSLGWSSLFAVLPLVALFVLLGVLRMRAWVAALLSLLVAIVVATVVYPMPLGQSLLAGTEGAVYGFFPILWIVVNAIWIYNMTVETGHFDVLRRSFATVSDDMRIQAVLITFCFGALLEALAGFGTPVAITSVMLIALGFKPLKAATVALVANTAPVAFGALAVPITTLSTVTGISQDNLGAMVGRQTPIVSVFVPLCLVFIVDRKRGLRDVWPAALLCGFVFGLFQYLASNFISVPLADIFASLLSAGAVVLLVRVWHPASTFVDTDEDEVVAGGGVATAERVESGDTMTATTTGGDDVPRRRRPHNDEPVLATGGRSTPDVPDTRAEIWRAYSPYLIIIAVFVIAQLPGIKPQIAKTTHIYHWPGLHIIGANGKASTIPNFTFNWLAASGTLLLIAGLITIPVLKISGSRALVAYVNTYKQLWTAIVTVMAVLALAYVMNASGQTATLGNWLAGAGGAFALLSPILGWLGVAVTGSDTSSNSLFGALQINAAQQAGLSQTLMAAGNSSGGVLGKMVSPQNLAIAAAAVGMAGREGELFRKVVGWSVLLLAIMVVIVFLQSTAVLSWMVV
jgi:lactate permease